MLGSAYKVIWKGKIIGSAVWLDVTSNLEKTLLHDCLIPN